MLTKADNHILTRVGPGTPMGNLLRRYWMPGFPATELPEADCPPIRLRLLGEDLVAFRDSSGRIGLVSQACPHRGASMFFGRNEEDGLRCVYHGWKFDTEGTCVDMPNEPAESNFKHKIHLNAYPCREANGVVWAYMGPGEPPELPALEFLSLPAENCYHPEVHFYDCNWVQALEGDIDSSHIDYLHARITKGHILESQLFLAPNNIDKNPHLEVLTTDYGAVYAAQRRWDNANNQWYRITQYCMPFYTMIAASGGDTVTVGAWVPLDDEHTTLIWMRANLNGPVPEERRRHSDPYSRIGGYLPRTGDPLSRYRSPAHRGNDYLLDSVKQRTEMFSGIPRDPKTQDQAMTESMGHIYERTNERLGTSDSMIILVRRLLINAAKTLRDQQAAPPTATNPSLYRVRSCSVVLPPHQNWVDATRDVRRSDAGLPVAFVKPD